MKVQKELINEILKIAGAQALLMRSVEEVDKATMLNEMQLAAIKKLFDDIKGDFGVSVDEAGGAIVSGINSKGNVFKPKNSFYIGKTGQIFKLIEKK